MKNILPLLLLLFAIIASCGRSTGHSSFPLSDAIDSIKFENPRAMARLLDSVGMPTDKRQCALWCYAYVKTKGKQGILQSDTLIDIACNYFMQQGTPREQWYVIQAKGDICFDRQEKDKAIECYLRAYDLAVELKDTSRLLQTLHNIGTVYIYYGEYKSRAAEYYKQCLDLATVSRDTAYLGVANLCMGRLYLRNFLGSPLYTDWEEGVRYYREAIRYCKLSNQEWAGAAALGELASLYNRHNKPHESLVCLQESAPVHFRLRPDHLPSLYLGFMKTYLNIGNIDSATVYANKVLAQVDKPSTRGEVYVSLYNYYLEKKEYDRCVFYNDSIHYYNDLSIAESLSLKIAETEQKYNQQKVLNEKNLLQIEKDRNLLIALLVLSFLLILIAALIYFYQRLLRRRERELRRNTLRLRENEWQIHRNEERVAQLQLQIEENQQLQEHWDEQQAQLDELQQVSKTLRSENRTLQADIHRASTTLQKREERLGELIDRLSNENRHLEEREQFLCQQVVLRTDVLQAIQHSPRYMDEPTWVEVRQALDVLFDGFTCRLGETIPALTEGELQIACLIKLHLSVSDMGILLGISPASVSQRKQRLKARILQVPGMSANEVLSLDSWVWNF